MERQRGVRFGQAGVVELGLARSCTVVCSSVRYGRNGSVASGEVKSGGVWLGLVWQERNGLVW